MPQPYNVFRVAAVVSSIVLVTGFVLLRGGGNVLPGSKSRPIMTTNESERTVLPGRKSGVISSPSDRTMLPGSKGGLIVNNASEIAAVEDAASTQPASQPGTLTNELQTIDPERIRQLMLMQSSKSFTPLIEPWTPSASTQPAQQSSESNAKQP